MEGEVLGRGHEFREEDVHYFSTLKTVNKELQGRGIRTYIKEIYIILYSMKHTLQMDQ